MEPLSEEMLFRWHHMVMSGRRDLKDVGRYRTGAEPMQVVSQTMHEPRVHFEAPPSSRVPSEMARFMAWFDQTERGKEKPLPALTRAGIAHLYFECIHPFEDGNGRIGRAISEKALAQSLGQPTLTALASKNRGRQCRERRLTEALRQRFLGNCSSDASVAILKGMDAFKIQVGNFCPS